MNLLITLTSAGLNSGPFNLYSDTDYYFTAFESDVPKQDLLDGYISTLVPDGTTIVRVQSDNALCTNYVDLSTVPTTTTTTTVAATYCTSWTAANEGNIKMSTQGYIDFTAILAGRTIEPGPLSVGTIVGYIVAGVGTFTCSIPMTFTTSKAQWNTDLLPAVEDKVLTSLIYNVEVVFNNSDEYSIVAGQTNAVVIPGQLTSEYNDCPVPTTTTTSSSSTSSSTTTTTTTTPSYQFSVNLGSAYCNTGVCYLDGTITNQIVYLPQGAEPTVGGYLYTDPALTVPFVTSQIISTYNMLLTTDPTGELFLVCNEGSTCP